MEKAGLYFNRMLDGGIDEIRVRVESSFKEVGFGVVTEIQMHEKFKEKLNVDFPKYIILGICNPKFAFEAVQLEENIGVFLPCKVVLKEKPGNKVEVLVLDPGAPMQIMNNNKLNELAKNVSQLLEGALNGV